MRAKNDVSLTLPLSIGRNAKWSGMSAAVRVIEAARSFVRALQLPSCLQSSE